MLFFNKPLGQQPWACPDKLPSQPVPHSQITFQPKWVAQDKEWRFEVALPWELVGLRDTDKIVGGNCSVGKGKVPTRLSPKDGLSLRMNFYRINDDDGGDATPRDDGVMEDALHNKSSDGILKNEWFVYQGDRFHPAEWATFVLSDQRRVNANESPKLEGTLTALSVSNADNRRVYLKFRAPSRATGGSVSRYVVRVQEGGGGVDEASWNSMPEFAQAYQPVPPGTEQKIDVIGLLPGKMYTIAVRAVDEVNRQSNILSVVVSLPNSNTEPFITVSPTGRSLVLTDYHPFVVVGETGLMPWLPLRGLYDGELCDENPSDFLKNPPSDFKQPIPASCGNNTFDKSGKPIDGRTRNYHNEKIFYRCEFPSGKLCNGELCEVALLEPSDTDASDNCQFVYGESPI